MPLPKDRRQKEMLILQLSFKTSNSPLSTTYLKSLSLHEAMKTQQLHSREPLLGNTRCKAFQGDMPNPTLPQGRHTSSFPCPPREGRSREGAA